MCGLEHQLPAVPQIRCSQPHNVQNYHVRTFCSSSLCMSGSGRVSVARPPSPFLHPPRRSVSQQNSDSRLTSSSFVSSPDGSRGATLHFNSTLPPKLKFTPNDVNSSKRCKFQQYEVAAQNVEYVINEPSASPFMNYKPVLRESTTLAGHETT